MKKPLTIIVGFVHDFSAGIWAAAFLAVWWLHREALDHPELSPLLQGLIRKFFWMGMAFAGSVLVTGAGRTFTYVDGVYGPEAEARRRRLLVFKHAALLALFVVGGIWQYFMAFR